MPDPQQPRTGKIPLKDFLNDFRSTTTDADLKKKYQLSARGFVSLIKALLEKGLITPQDLTRRKEMAVQRDLAKESQFLSGLFLCPNCSHPHPGPFDMCPACGVVLGEAHAAEELLDSVFSTTGSHMIVPETDAVTVTDAETLGDTQLLPSMQDTQLLTPEDLKRGEEQEETAEPEKPKKKASPLRSVRSFLSKLKKK